MPPHHPVRLGVTGILQSVKRFAACCLTLLGIAVGASAQQIILIPLDDRPATGQFAQMIAKMAGITVKMPPEHLLGRFTTPGQPEELLNWLSRENMANTTAVIVNTDMIAFGGLIASRTIDTPQETAIKRLQRLAEIKKANPTVPFFACSSIMRLTPTATKSTAAWRLQLGRYAEVKERYRRTLDKKYLETIRNLQAKIPPQEIQRYEQIRSRNHAVQMQLIDQLRSFTYEYLLFGQDDAQPYGPHIPETQKLKAKATGSGVGGKVYFGEGVDQMANILVSRSLLRAQGWTPRVRLVYSDDAEKKSIADYESKTIEESLRDQLLSSGSRPSTTDQYDYALFLNTPNRRDSKFHEFTEALTTEVDQSFPVAVADIDLGKDGTSDPELFSALNQQGRMVKLLAYAGWNTAGNTMGTTIPAANTYLLARRSATGELQRELARREFILHRFANDFAYHKFVRPRAYQMIDSTPDASREETYGPAFDSVNSFVQQELSRYLEETFNTQFLGQKFFAGSKQYEIDGIENIRVNLPWPRAYEVRLEFNLRASEVISLGNFTFRPITRLWPWS